MPDHELSDDGSLNIKMWNFMLWALVWAKSSNKAKTEPFRLFSFTWSDVTEVKEAKLLSENLKPQDDWNEEKERIYIMLGDQKGAVSIWNISRVAESLNIKAEQPYAAMKMSFSLWKEEINAAPIFKSEI